MSQDINQPLDLEVRRRAAYFTLSEVLQGDHLLQAMWMIEERDQSADRLTFIGIVGVTAELFGIENQTISSLYLKLNKTLGLSSNDLPPDPLPEMLWFREVNSKQILDSIQTPSDNPLPHLTATSSSIFQANDMLGTVDKELTQKTIFQMGQALAFEAKKHHCQTLIMARDEGESSIELGQALAKGILSTGLNVIDLGNVPISVLNFVIYHFDGKGGVMITGGHHSSEYNGLKMVVAGEMLEGEKIHQIKKHVETVDFSSVTIGSLEKNEHYINEYIGMICEDVQLSNPIKIVINNGPASNLAAKLLTAIGCAVIEPDDEYITAKNSADYVCKTEATTDLISKIKEHQADIGFVFDNEGARLKVIDSHGNMIRSDRQMMLFSKAILADYPCSEIIHDTQDNGNLANLIRHHGGRPSELKTGSVYMRKKLKSDAAKLAGDMHGHIYFNDRWFGFDDALYTACRMVEILSKDSRSSHQVFSELPESLIMEEALIELKEGENKKVLQKLTDDAEFSSANVADIDGLRIDFTQGWVFIRIDEVFSSLVLHFEAENQTTLMSIQNQCKALLLKVKPDLDVNF